MKSTKVYVGVGYPVDPRLEEIRFRRLRRLRRWFECRADLFDYQAAYRAALSRIEYPFICGGSDHNLDGIVRSDRERLRAMKRERGRNWVRTGKLLNGMTP